MSNNEIQLEPNQRIVTVDDESRKHRDLILGQFSSQYDPEIAIEIITMMANGFTLNASCGKVLKAPITIQRWREDNPDFDKAITVALAARQYFLENKFLSTKLASDVTKYIFALKVSKTSTDWIEDNTRKVELSGPDGKPIQTQNTVEAITYTVVDPVQSVDDDQLPEIEGEVIEEK